MVRRTLPFLVLLVTLLCVCNEACEPEHLGWSSWNSWGGCSKNCDNGYRVRYRNCCRQGMCYGSNKEYGVCNPQQCTDDREDLYCSDLALSYVPSTERTLIKVSVAEKAVEREVMNSIVNFCSRNRHHCCNSPAVDYRNNNVDNFDSDLANHVWTPVESPLQTTHYINQRVRLGYLQEVVCGGPQTCLSNEVLKYNIFNREFELRIDKITETQVALTQVLPAEPTDRIPETTTPTPTSGKPKLRNRWDLILSISIGCVGALVGIICAVYFGWRPKALQTAEKPGHGMDKEITFEAPPIYTIENQKTLEAGINLGPVVEVMTDATSKEPGNVTNI